MDSVDYVFASLDARAGKGIGLNIQEACQLLSQAIVFASDYTDSNLAKRIAVLVGRAVSQIDVVTNSPNVSDLELTLERLGVELCHVARGFGNDFAGEVYGASLRSIGLAFSLPDYRRRMVQASQPSIPAPDSLALIKKGTDAILRDIGHKFYMGNRHILC